ncbi:MAG: orotidine-5'-phosphate decarboxylase [Chthonomonadales bacterium]
MDPRDRIILALDVKTADEALILAEKLHPYVGAFKVGMELVHAAGYSIFDRLKSAGVGRIFYDCKLHDIPNTVGSAMKVIGAKGLWMTNVHATGGLRMVRAAAEGLVEGQKSSGATNPTILLGVTVLTSLSPEELNEELCVPLTPEHYVVHLAKLTQAAGAQGVVSSPHEIEAVRAACGPDFAIVTPGVRPAGVDSGDQRRIMTPSEAIKRGATYLVIGRAVTAATDHVAAAKSIESEIASVV